MRYVYGVILLGTFGCSALAPPLEESSVVGGTSKGETAINQVLLEQQNPQVLQPISGASWSLTLMKSSEVPVVVRICRNDVCGEKSFEQPESVHAFNSDGTAVVELLRPTRAEFRVFGARIVGDRGSRSAQASFGGDSDGGPGRRDIASLPRCNYLGPLYAEDGIDGDCSVFSCNDQDVVKCANYCASVSSESENRLCSIRVCRDWQKNVDWAQIDLCDSEAPFPYCEFADDEGTFLPPDVSCQPRSELPPAYARYFEEVWWDKATAAVFWCEENSGRGRPVTLCSPRCTRTSGPTTSGIPAKCDFMCEEFDQQGTTIDTYSTTLSCSLDPKWLSASETFATDAMGIPGRVGFEVEDPN